MSEAEYENLPEGPLETHDPHSVVQENDRDKVHDQLQAVKQDEKRRKQQLAETKDQIRKLEPFVQNEPPEVSTSAIDTQMVSLASALPERTRAAKSDVRRLCSARKVTCRTT